jgi:hypothetical protein
MIHAVLLAAAVALSPAQIDSMLASAERTFNNYVFPDVAAKTVEMLRRNTPRYENISDPKAFISAVNADLYASTHDKHVNIWYPFDASAFGDKPNEAIAHHIESFENYGFREARRLPGNVGYLAFDYFSDDTQVATAIESAMRFVAGTDALIIDLRQNGGGNPRAAQTLEAYFFSKPQQLTSILRRNPKNGAITEERQYTARAVAGPLYLNKPVYVLTSSRTISCAEQLSYDLHNLKRVTLFGETTAGGANPGSAHAIAPQFAIFIPDGRAYSHVTHTNWEGTGVKPDVAVPAADALVRAYTAALRESQKREKQPELLDAISRALANPSKALSE